MVAILRDLQLSADPSQLSDFVWARKSCIRPRAIYDLTRRSWSSAQDSNCDTRTIHATRVPSDVRWLVLCPTWFSIRPLLAISTHRTVVVSGTAHILLTTDTKSIVVNTPGQDHHWEGLHRWVLWYELVGISWTRVGDFHLTYRFQILFSSTCEVYAAFSMGACIKDQTLWRVVE